MLTVLIPLVYPVQSPPVTEELVMSWEMSETTGKLTQDTAFG